MIFKKRSYNKLTVLASHINRICLSFLSSRSYKPHVFQHTHTPHRNPPKCNVRGKFHTSPVANIRLSVLSLRAATARSSSQQQRSRRRCRQPRPLPSGRGWRTSRNHQPVTVTAALRPRDTRQLSAPRSCAPYQTARVQFAAVRSTRQRHRPSSTNCSGPPAPPTSPPPSPSTSTPCASARLAFDAQQSAHGVQASASAGRVSDHNAGRTGDAIDGGRTVRTASRQRCRHDGQSGHVGLQRRRRR